MITCTRCSSKLEEWELNNGACPFCFPKTPELVRPMTIKETEEVLGKGCPTCHTPWSKSMGVHYCKTCSSVPPTHVRLYNG